MFTDGPWLLIALALYVGGAVAALVARGRTEYIAPMVLVGLALVCHSVSIVARWERLGHGPYVNLFEVLSSNVWSLHVAVLVACLAIRAIRPSLTTVLPVLQILVVWLLLLTPTDSEAPVTYATVWLAVHVWLGKIFLGCLMVAVGVSLVVLARRAGAARMFEVMPANAVLDEFVYRFVLVAFIFESLMIIAGAIWAQDAWGRYWAWDPLETSAFVTWLAVIAYLHVRAIRRPPPALSAIMVIGIFALAFSTLFGLPFVSTAPHKGAL